MAWLLSHFRILLIVQYSRADSPRLAIRSQQLITIIGLSREPIAVATHLSNDSREPATPQDNTPSSDGPKSCKASEEMPKNVRQKRKRPQNIEARRLQGLSSFRDVRSAGSPSWPTNNIASHQNREMR
jgi:hypothetical protein